MTPLVLLKFTGAFNAQSCYVNPQEVAAIKHGTLGDELGTTIWLRANNYPLLVTEDIEKVRAMLQGEQS